MIARIIDFVRRAPRYTAWIIFLAGLFGVGVLGILWVLIEGLHLTNLNNQLPWGLWITVDLSAIALGAGAFTLSGAVYVLRLNRFEAIARAAVVMGLLGYTSAMIALFVDIGHPDRFYHPLLYWNVHSVLWEITLCVMLYTTVLITEVIPIVIESTPLRNNGIMRRLAHVLHTIMPVMALLGIGLSLLHQSSLGATYGVLVARPVWFNPSAPVLFILSAVAGGVGATLAVTTLTGFVKGQQLVPKDVMDRVAIFAGAMFLAYLYLKIWSWAATNYYSHTPALEHDMELLGEHTPYGFTFWWFEILLGALLPAILLLWSRTRRNPMTIVLAGALGAFGVIVFRWNMTLAGFVVPMDWSPGVADNLNIASYTPAPVEWMVAIGISAYWLLLWSLAARFLNLYPMARPFRNGVNNVAPASTPPPSEAPGDEGGKSAPAPAR